MSVVKIFNGFWVDPSCIESFSLRTKRSERRRFLIRDVPELYELDIVYKSAGAFMHHTVESESFEKLNRFLDECAGAVAKWRGNELGA